MNSWNRILFVVCVLGLAACHSKQSADAINSPSTADSPSELEAIKSPAMVQNRSAGLSHLEKPYFAKIQILSETLRGAGCADAQRRTEEVKEDYQVGITEEGQLKPLQPRVHPVNSVFNVELRSIGFDELSYRVTVWDAKSAARLPYDLDLRARPGGTVELSFLGKLSQLRFDQTPVYTFSATEHRGACAITHNVNLFAEKAGSRDWQASN